MRSDLKSGRDFVSQQEQKRTLYYCCCSVWSQTLCDPKDTRLPRPSLSPGVCSDSCSLSRWCYPTVSSSCPLQEWGLSSIANAVHQAQREHWAPLGSFRVFKLYPRCLPCSTYELKTTEHKQGSELSLNLVRFKKSLLGLVFSPGPQTLCRSSVE